MKFWEAMKALEEGKRVRCIGWIGLNSFCSKNLTCGEDANRMLLHHGWLLEWELYEKPEQTLSFAEVVKGLKEGKIFRRKGWSDRDAIIESTSCKFYPSTKRINNQHGDLCPLWLEDFEANDWVEVR